MHHIMRERREASISVENMVAGTQNEGMFDENFTVTILEVL